MIDFVYIGVGLVVVLVAALLSQVSRRPSVDPMIF
jgi:hypothetical protein